MWMRAASAPSAEGTGSGPQHSPFCTPGPISPRALFMMAVLPRRAPHGPGSLLNALWALELRGSPWLDEPDDSIWGRRYCPQVLLGAVAVMTPILLKRPQGSALFPWHQGWV